MFRSTEAEGPLLGGGQLVLEVKFWRLNHDIFGIFSSPNDQLMINRVDFSFLLTDTLLLCHRMHVVIVRCPSELNAINDLIFSPF